MCLCSNTVCVSWCIVITVKTLLLMKVKNLQWLQSNSIYVVLLQPIFLVCNNVTSLRTWWRPRAICGVAYGEGIRSNISLAYSLDINIFQVLLSRNFPDDFNQTLMGGLVGLHPFASKLCADVIICHHMNVKRTRNEASGGVGLLDVCCLQPLPNRTSASRCVQTPLPVNTHM